MIEKFKKHLEDNFSFLKKSKVYIAVSGGIDSMVLSDLFDKTGYNYAILHCNFQLRGAESDNDLDFLLNYFTKKNIRFVHTCFETEKYANQKKISIQMAARELRYNWFQEQKVVQNFDYLLTAHHLDDSLETFIINLTRGTGIKGLMGIPEINDNIVRPLLPFSRLEIDAYAKKNKIIWREDSSNESEKYLRNNIRHILVPQLKVYNDDFLNSFQKTQTYLTETSKLADDAVQVMIDLICEKKENGLYLDIEKLTHYTNYKSYLYQIFKKYNFTAWADIYDLINSQTGKKVYSDDYVLMKNRNYLILYLKSENEDFEEYFVEKNQLEVKIPLKINFCNVTDILQTDSSSIFVDENKLKFPLIIRKYNEADIFFPFGMKGSKKVSKFFKDEKISLLDKKKTWLLCSDNKIVWIINHRLDERFKVSNDTKKILKISTQ